MGEYKITENSCPAPTQADQERASYTSHNPTLTRNLALITWHSGGFEAIDIEDPAEMQQTGWFSPTPLAQVANKDPALSMGTNKVVMWSFPIVKDGLIYVIDLRKRTVRAAVHRTPVPRGDGPDVPRGQLESRGRGGLDKSGRP